MSVLIKGMEMPVSCCDCPFNRLLIPNKIEILRCLVNERKIFKDYVTSCRDEHCPLDEADTESEHGENKYLMWQYCNDPNDISKAIKEHDENWEGLESLHQIISITYDTNHGCYVVFWIAEDDNGIS